MTIVETARNYNKLGWSVFPVSSGTAKKKPLVKWTKFQDKLQSEGATVSLFGKFPDAGIGVATGKLSGLCVIDFETTEAIRRFEASICALPQTIVSVTGRASGEGRHYFFRYPAGYNLRNSAKKYKDTDFRGEGGYVVLPPSKHHSGKSYHWDGIDPLEMGLDDLCDMPIEAIKFFCDEKRTENREGWVEELLLGVSEGSRNDAAAKYCGWLLNRNGGNTSIAWDALRTWNNRNRPPMPEKELKVVLESIAAREGTNLFEHRTGIVIDHLEILKYPDGNKEYCLHVKGVDETVRLSPADLCRPAAFEVKLLQITDHLFQLPRKLGAWRNLINPLLEEATRVMVSEEETDIATLEDIVSNDLKEGGADPEDPDKMLDWSAVSLDGVVYLKMSTLLNKKIEHTSLRGFNRKKLSSLLRVAGFTYSDRAVRFGERVFKLWSR